MNTFTRLRDANRSRQTKWDAGNKIGLAYRANELAGETGEACNVAKKIERERLGLKGSRATIDDLADELADVVICADLVAMAENIDLDAAVARKFNLTSEKVGFPERLALPDMINNFTRGSAQPYASIEYLQAWASGLMQRPADFTILTRAGADYLRRWWVVPRSQFCNVYLHEIVASDDDRALHDHPWDSTSMLIAGSYIEHTPEGSFLRQAGDVVTRKATDSHRLEIPEGGRAVSLFITGPKVRDWGFHCPKGWVLWSDFVDDTDNGKIGRGCGETGTHTPAQRAD